MSVLVLSPAPICFIYHSTGPVGVLFNLFDNASAFGPGILNSRILPK